MSYKYVCDVLVSSSNTKPPPLSPRRGQSRAAAAKKGDKKEDDWRPQLLGRRLHLILWPRSPGKTTLGFFSNGAFSRGFQTGCWCILLCPQYTVIMVDTCNKEKKSSFLLDMLPRAERPQNWATCLPVPPLICLFRIIVAAPKIFLRKMVGTQI